MGYISAQHASYASILAFNALKAFMSLSSPLDYFLWLVLFSFVSRCRSNIC